MNGVHSLAKLSAAETALAKASTLEEVKAIMDIAEAARVYARKAKQSLDVQNHAAELKLRAERKAGGFLKPLKRNPRGRRRQIDQPGQFSEYQSVLDDGNIARTTAERWITEFDLPQDVFDGYIATAHATPDQELGAAALQRLARKLKSGKVYPLSAANHAASDDPDYDGDEWFTPLDYIEAARAVMGEIDLDPASCDEAQARIRATSYMTKEDNALSFDLQWFGRVWLNPPYSTPLIRFFVAKLIAQYEARNVTQAIILTNNSSDTGWFHDLLSRFPACFTRGRAQFWRADSMTFGARQGQTLFYLGDAPDTFFDVFRRIGQVVVRYDNQRS